MITQGVKALSPDIRATLVHQVRQFGDFEAAGLTHAADWVHRRYCVFSDVDALI
jgi:hypothetical protein